MGVVMGIGLQDRSVYERMQQECTYARQRPHIGDYVLGFGLVEQVAPHLVCRPLFLQDGGFTGSVYPLWLYVGVAQWLGPDRDEGWQWEW